MVHHCCDILGARSKDALQIDFVIVAAFLVQAIVVYLPGDQQNRRRIAPRLGDARKRIGRAGPRRRADDARLARDARISVRREGARLLVADEDRANTAMPFDRIIDGDRMRARHAENDAHAGVVKRLHKQVGAGHGMESQSVDSPLL
jgi:hypothetical protein